MSSFEAWLDDQLALFLMDVLSVIGRATPEEIVGARRPATPILPSTGGPPTSLALRRGALVQAWTRKYGLTIAETDVLRFAATGKSMDQIARARGVSRFTVQTQFKSMLRKTGEHLRDRLIVRFLLELLRK